MYYSICILNELMNINVLYMLNPVELVLVMKILT